MITLRRLLLFSFLLFLSIALFAQKNMDWKVPPYEVEEIDMDQTPFPQFLEDEKGLKIEYVLIGLPDSLQRKIKKVQIEEEDPHVYTAGEIDRMPLFEETCASAADPMACSLEKANEFFRENIDNANINLAAGETGLVKLVFVINENGWIEDKIRVVKADNACQGCRKAAVETAYNMPAWAPARSDGKKVKAMLVLPIQFENEISYDNR